MLAYVRILRWDESKHPRDKEGKFSETVGTIRGEVRTSAEQARRDLVALGRKTERMELRWTKAAEQARGAWAAFMEATQKGRKKPLKPDGAAAKKLPEYKAANAADEEVHKASEAYFRYRDAAKTEALKQLLVPQRERSRVKFLVPKGELNSDPRVEEGIANGAGRALDIFRRYDGSGSLVGLAIPADRVEKAKEVLGDVEFDTDPDGTVRIAKRLRLTKTKEGIRANATPFGVQVGGTRELERTIHHEVGHHVEFANSTIYDAAVATRAKLATDPNVTKTLNDIKGGENYGYGPDEIAIPGKFLEPYSGKVYPAEARATEMLSTGMEFYLQDPIRFAREAPDHFKFVWDVMHGKYRRD